MIVYELMSGIIKLHQSSMIIELKF